jgi:hypothetical protein
MFLNLKDIHYKNYNFKHSLCFYTLSKSFRLLILSFIKKASSLFITIKINYYIIIVAVTKEYQVENCFVAAYINFSL